MIWTYRVFRDNNGRYSVREIYYEHDGTIIAYSKAPVTPVGSSFKDLMQQVQWFQDAFDLPVLSLEEIDAQIAAQPVKPQSESGKNIPLRQIIAELEQEEDDGSLKPTVAQEPISAD